MSLLLKSTGNYFSSSSNSFVENCITNFQVRALNSIVKVNYFQIYWWSATNDIIQSSINENKNKIAQIKWSTSPPLLTCLYYELLVSMEHIVQLIDFILPWSITLTCDGLKRALEQEVTDRHWKFDTKQGLYKLSRPSLLHCACFLNASADVYQGGEHLI